MEDTKNHDWTIRAAASADLDALVAGNVAIAWETEALRLDVAVVNRGVAAALADPGRGFYLVATDRAGGVVGQLMVTFEWSDWRAAWWYWIQSVYVVPTARRRGVYRVLHEAVVARAREAAHPVAGIRLYVEHDNERAQETYASVGMSPAVYRIYEQTLGAGSGADEA